VNVEIVQFETTRVAALEHRGPAEKVNDSVARFIAWRKESGLSPKLLSRSFGIAYDNPDTTDPDQFRFDICGEERAGLPPNPQGVLSKTIPGGRCARVRHLGTHARIGESIYPLYRDWLPDTPENELITDIYLPLKKSGPVPAAEAGFTTSATAAVLRRRYHVAA